MRGLMQGFPLVIPGLLEHAERNHAKTEIVTRRLEGDIHRYFFPDMAARSRQLARALHRLGVSAGDAVGTIAWNTYRHMELYYALPGIGAIYHTINPRLSPQQLSYVISHAQDKYLFVEAMFLPLLEGIADELSGLRGVVVLCDEALMPESSLGNVLCYESLLSAETDDEIRWADMDENSAAGICYTSGTTGNPKGVVYSHRSLVLQALNTAIGLELTPRDVVLPIVPMFHVNAWTIPFMAAVLGTKLVLPGKDLDGASVFELLENEQVTFSAGVPTVWQMLFEHLEATGSSPTYLKKACIGGSAASRSMLETFQGRYGVEPMHAWGMTETTSMGSAPAITSSVEARGAEAILDAKMSQGRAVYGARLRIVNDAGEELARDGSTPGHLQVGGWAVASGYLNREDREEWTEDGWFDTGDIATLDAEGYLRLTDRAKDVIKSGGEWISSIDLENAALAHVDIVAAAVIGIAHPKWDERPLLVVVLREGASLDKDSIMACLAERVAKWWLPDDIQVVEALPIGATGKVQKNLLREAFSDYKLPGMA